MSRFCSISLCPIAERGSALMSCCLMLAFFAMTVVVLPRLVPNSGLDQDVALGAVIGDIRLNNPWLLRGYAGDLVLPNVSFELQRVVESVKRFTGRDYCAAAIDNRSGMPLVEQWQCTSGILTAAHISACESGVDGASYAPYMLCAVHAAAPDKHAIAYAAINLAGDLSAAATTTNSSFSGGAHTVAGSGSGSGPGAGSGSGSGSAGSGAGGAGGGASHGGTSGVGSDTSSTPGDVLSLADFTAHTAPTSPGLGSAGSPSGLSGTDLLGAMPTGGTGSSGAGQSGTSPDMILVPDMSLLL